MTILIADDHTIVRRGVTYMIRDRFPVAQVWEASDADELLSLLKERTFGLLMCDINMPGCNNLAIIDTVRQLSPETPILMFSAFREELYGWRCIKAGAKGYLQKDSPEEEMLRAIQMVYDGKVYISPALQKHLLEQDVTSRQHPLSGLSQRELDIAVMVAAGKRLKEIGATLDLHVSSVNTYKRRVFEKLKIDNVADLIALLESSNRSDS